MTEYKSTVIGDHGTYDSMEAWQRAERSLDYYEPINKRPLLDKFAMAALSGLCVNEKYYSGMDKPNKYKQIADEAYNYAEEMMKRRDKA